MTKEQATELINIYGKAWMTQDADLILTIFTPDATYNDSKVPEANGHEGIREYWVSKVIGEQKDIKFTLKNVQIEGDKVIADWHATFIDTKRKLFIEMDETAIFTVRDGIFSSINESYVTKKTPVTDVAEI